MAREAALILTLAGLIGTSWCLRDDPVVPAATTPPLSIAERAPDPVAPASSTIPEPTPEESRPDRSRMLELPDGTFVETLNDAIDAAPLARYWGPSPWSPILGIERSSAGVDWYRHADGSYSTTQMVWRSDLGRHAAMTRVAHPGPEPAAIAPRK